MFYSNSFLDNSSAFINHVFSSFLNITDIVLLLSFVLCLCLFSPFLSFLTTGSEPGIESLSVKTGKTLIAFFRYFSMCNESLNQVGKSGRKEDPCAHMKIHVCALCPGISWGCDKEV